MGAISSVDHGVMVLWWFNMTSNPNNGVSWYAPVDCSWLYLQLSRLILALYGQWTALLRGKPNVLSIVAPYWLFPLLDLERHVAKCAHCR